MNKIYHRSGHYITYSIQSGKSPYVVFLHGLMSDMHGKKAVAIEKFLKTLGNGYIRFNCRGHGESEGNFPDFGIDDWADDASLIINDLPKEPVILVGSSMGGWSMLLNAVKNPELIKGLIGIAAAPDFTEDMLSKLSKNKQNILFSQGFIEIPSEYSDKPYVISKKLIDSGKNNLLLNSSIPIKCPVQLFHGGKDEDVPLENSLKLIEKIESENIKLTFVKDANHQFSRESDLKLIFKAIDEMISN